MNNLKKEIGQAYNLGIEYEVIENLTKTIYNGGGNTDA